MKSIRSIFLCLSLFASFEAYAQVIKDLKIAVVQEWSQFNPVTYNLASTEAFLHFVMRPMTLYAPNGSIVADLAEQIPTKKNGKVQIVKDNGKSKVVAQWNIKAKANWGDGKPITCKDWWMSWQVGLSPNVSTLEKTAYTKIEKIEWADTKPKECKVTYASDDWTFDRDLPIPIPAHLEGPVFEKWKNQSQAYEQNSIYVKDPANKGLYSGPYVIQEYVLGSHFILSVNSHFYGQQPQISKVSVKHIGDANTLRSHLSTKEINMISAVGFPPDMALAMDQEFKKAQSESNVYFNESPIFQGIFMNLDQEILKDIKLREALWKAIDKEELVKAFFQNKMLAAETFLPERSPAFQKRKSQYSLSDARKLLDEAGWKSEGSGVRKKNGQPLNLEFRTSAGIKILETIQTYICSQFQKIGAQCVVKNQPPRVFLGDSVTKGDFVLGMFGQPVLPDSSLKALFHSKEIPTKENAWTGGNSIRFKNASLDEKLLAFDREWNPKKRLQLVREMEKILLAEKPFIPLYHRKEAYVIPKKLQGFQGDLKGTGFIYPENWH